MFMVCDILGLCCIVNCNVCMFLLWLPYGVIDYNNTCLRLSLLREMSAPTTLRYHIYTSFNQLRILFYLVDAFC